MNRRAFVGKAAGLFGAVLAAWGALVRNLMASEPEDKQPSFESAAPLFLGYEWVPKTYQFHGMEHGVLIFRFMATDGYRFENRYTFPHAFPFSTKTGDWDKMIGKHVAWGFDPR